MLMHDRQCTTIDVNPKKANKKKKEIFLGGQNNDRQQAIRKTHLQ